MFNPLTDDYADLSDDEINAKINELVKKYHQTRNSHLQSQMIVILDMLRQEQQLRQSRKQEETRSDNDPDLDNLININ